jgi:hypothetical protein
MQTHAPAHNRYTNGAVQQPAVTLALLQLPAHLHAHLLSRFLPACGEKCNFLTSYFSVCCTAWLTVLAARIAALEAQLAEAQLQQ